MPGSLPRKARIWRRGKKDNAPQIHGAGLLSSPAPARFGRYSGKKGIRPERLSSGARLLNPYDDRSRLAVTRLHGDGGRACLDGGHHALVGYGQHLLVAG